MENKTSVYFFDELVGELSQDKYGTICFQYNRDYLAKNGKPISNSLPLTTEMYYGNEAHAFFTGLLPEENMLTATANAIGTSTTASGRFLSSHGNSKSKQIGIRWRSYV
jgi:serine/threonine-protein kinase HipA